MAKVRVEAEYEVGAERLWDLIGDFQTIAAWHPAIEAAVEEDGGRKRRLKLANGAEVVETLEDEDGKARRYTYSLPAGALPMTGYRSTLSVAETAPGRCKATWEGEFTPAGGDDPSALIREIYESGLANAKKLLGG